MSAAHLTLDLRDAAMTQQLGARIAQAIVDAHARPCCIALAGDLGAGKTTLAGGLLRALGHTGHVKSPTYTLVEAYELERGPALHLDLYRVADPEELEFLGVREWLDRDAVVLVEWAERGHGFLPAVDLDVMLSPSGTGRRAELDARTPRGKKLLSVLSTAPLSGSENT